MLDVEARDDPPARGGRRPGASLLPRVSLALAATGLIAGLLSLLAWQRAQSQRTACQSNQRRLAIALLLYAQDNEGCLPPPEQRRSDGGWRTWVDALEPYVVREGTTVCPANPAQGARNPYQGYPFPHSFALNERFYGVFAPGPFPIENLEIQARTVLLVEGGWFRAEGPFGRPTYPWAMSVYWDTAWWPNVYPSPHAGRMNVVAADGHAITVTVAHYSAADHDPLYGRLGGTIYNWNGGHPNGETSGPPRE